MASSPFDPSSAQLGLRASGSTGQGQYSAKSPLSLSNQPAHRLSNQAGSSPAKAMMTFSGSHSSPSTSQHNVPSPATFANIAAAVGVQNPLEDANRIVSNRIGGNKVRDPYTELLSNLDIFLNVQLTQLESAGNAFFDRYEGALHEHSDSRKVVEAHRNLLSIYDQLMNTSIQLGLAALPCPGLDTATSNKAPTLDEMHSRLMTETKNTFERRERLREGASMVTSILTQNRDGRVS